MMHEMFINMDKQKQFTFAITVVVVNSFHMFNANELEEGGQSMYSSMGVQDVLTTM